MRLGRAGGALVCGRGHAFDLAREGHVNVLQPQDRRSLAAGDASGTVEARLRLAAIGADRELHLAVREWVAGLARPRPVVYMRSPLAVLEVGAGPGVLLGGLLSEGLEAYGLDLSAPAVGRAARAHPGACWIVANADRRLPFLEGSLDVVLSMRGPKHAAEFARVLRPTGDLLLGVPGRQDLAELRRATAGEALPRDPAERALESFAQHFELAGRREVVQTLVLDRGGIRDLLAAVDRGARRTEAERADGLEQLAITQATTLLHLRPIPQG